MPNRILREGILTSPRIAKVGWAEEVMYRRLMSIVDDFGRYYGDEGLLRAACYPRQLNKVSDSDVGKWLTVLVEAALVRVYPAEDGERYLELLRFGQQVRAKKSRFPDPAQHPPNNGEAVAQHLLSKQPADAPVFVSVFGDVSVLSAGKPASEIDGFDAFYAAYPRKAKPKDARKAWDKLKPDATLMDRMLKAIEAQKKSDLWRKEGGQFIPYPARWLDGGDWENRSPEVASSSSDAVAESAEYLRQQAEHAKLAVPPPAEVMERIKGSVRRVQ